MSLSLFFLQLQNDDDSGTGFVIEDINYPPLVEGINYPPLVETNANNLYFTHYNMGSTTIPYQRRMSDEYPNSLPYLLSGSSPTPSIPPPMSLI